MLKSLRTLGALLLLATAALAQAETVYIDVRTVEEFAADHIEGDLNLPLAELDPTKLAERYGKEAEIVLYCRSGNRAGQAMTRLQEAGFTQVSNGGGIDDIRKLRSIALQSGAGATAPVTGAPPR